jgi:anti-anti-sigma regulatory factor
MFSVDERPEAVVLNVIGALDHSVTDALERAFETWRNLETKRVLMSLEHCTYVDSAAASVIGRFRTALGPRFAIASGANIPPTVLDVLTDEDVPVNLERLIFCDRCTHGLMRHGMTGCRFSHCRCTMSSGRLIAEALESTKPGNREESERAGPRILHRYFSKSSKYD